MSRSEIMRIKRKPYINRETGAMFTDWYWQSNAKSCLPVFVMRTYPDSKDQSSTEQVSERIKVCAYFVTQYKEVVSASGIHLECIDRNPVQREPLADVIPLVADNLRMCTVQPPIFANVAIPNSVKPFGEEVEDIWYEVFEEMKIEEVDCRKYSEDGELVVKMHPIDAAKESYLSTERATDCAASFNKIAQPIPDVDVDPAEMMQGMAMMLKEHDLIDDQGEPRTIDPPEFNSFKIMGMSFPGKKKCGFAEQPHVDDEGTAGHQTGFKEDMFLHTLLVFMMYFGTLGVMWAAGNGFDALFHFALDNGDFLTKMAMKTELREPWEKAGKIRLFFLDPFLGYFFGKITMEPEHDYFKNRGGSTIGLNWLTGGASYLADKLKFSEGKIFTKTGRVLKEESTRMFFCADVKSKDVKFTPKELHFLVWVWMMFRTPSASFRYMFYLVLLAVRAHWTMYHILNWPGGIWRWCIGVLCSGDYNTSFLNTIHMVWISYCYCVWSYHKTGDERCLHAQRTGDFVCVIQGDNILGSYSKSLAPLMNEKGFYEYMGRWNQTIKPGSDFVSDSAYTVVAKNGMVPLERYEFLKRCFVYVKRDGVWRTEPFRGTMDVVYRLYKHVTKITTIEVYCSRILGLMADTLGTNEISYALCYLFLQKVVARHGNVISNMIEGGDHDKFLEERIMKFFDENMELPDIIKLIKNRQGLLKRVRSDHRNCHDYEQSYKLRPMCKSKY